MKARKAAFIENLQIFRVLDATVIEDLISIALHSREVLIVGPTTGRVGEHMEIRILDGKRELEDLSFSHKCTACF